MLLHGGRLVRLRGGFWTTPGMPTNARGAPSWYVDVRTVRAMERLGVLRREDGPGPEWCADRVLSKENP